MSDLAEIVGFLNHEKPAVRLQAVSIIAAQTGESADISEQLRKLDVVKPLARLIKDSPDISLMATTVLLNLSDSDYMVSQMVAEKVIGAVMDVLVTRHDQVNKHLAFGLLANVTR
jgi:hypothetical protein